MHDGRFKPDLVAPGESILSAKAQISGAVDHCGVGSSQFNSINNSLTFHDGTSMATPLMAGTMEYLRQYFLQGYYPSGIRVFSNRFASVPESLLRAVILAGSRQIFGTVKLENDNVASLPS